MPDHESEQQLSDLGKRIHEARREAGLLPETQPSTQAGSGRGMQAGFELVVAVLVCSFLGLGADRMVGTTPLFLLVGLVLGFAAGMWSLYRSSLDN